MLLSILSVSLLGRNQVESSEFDADSKVMDVSAPVGRIRSVAVGRQLSIVVSHWRGIRVSQRVASQCKSPGSSGCRHFDRRFDSSHRCSQQAAMVVVVSRGMPRVLVPD